MQSGYVYLDKCAVAQYKNDKQQHQNNKYIQSIIYTHKFITKKCQTTENKMELHINLC